MVSALIVVQIVLLAETIGAFAFMLSSLWATLWATLRVTFVGVPESAPEENEAEERPDARSWRYEYYEYGSRGPVVVHLRRRIRRSAMSGRGRRRGRRRGRKSRKTGRGDRTGKVTEETYEL